MAEDKPSVVVVQAGESLTKKKKPKAEDKVAEEAKAKVSKTDKKKK